MPRKKTEDTNKILTGVIINAMLDRKARRPVILGFQNHNNAICDAFIICHGTSKTQVEAIADHIIMEVKKKTGSIPWHLEGFENAEWILIDYNDIIVHIFQDSRREFYNLEQLWADAEIKQVDSPD